MGCSPDVASNLLGGLARLQQQPERQLVTNLLCLSFKPSLVLKMESRLFSMASLVLWDLALTFLSELLVLHPPCFLCCGCFFSSSF